MPGSAKISGDGSSAPASIWRSRPTARCPMPSALLLPYAQSIAESQGQPRTAGSTRDDPHLLMWVHVAEVDSFLTAYQAFGAEKLTPAEADDYVRQCGSIASLLGVIEPPTTVREMKAIIESFRPELTGSGLARQASNLLLVQPPFTGLGRAELSPAGRGSRLDPPGMGSRGAAAAGASNHRTCSDETAGPLRHVRAALGADGSVNKPDSAVGPEGPGDLPRLEIKVGQDFSVAYPGQPQVESSSGPAFGRIPIRDDQ